MVKIAFHSLGLDVRGTCVSMYDYAHYSETILGHHSIIIIQEDSINDDDVLRKFKNRFKVIYYSDPIDMDNVLVSEGCHIMYCIKYGTNNGLISKKIKNAIHCVFDLSQPHGDAYAAVSSTLANKYNYPHYVPHMIGLRPSRTSDNMRNTLNIPSDAVVFGRHGGQDTFDLDIAKNAISRIVRDCPNTYFIFVNTPMFDNHPNIHYIDKIVDIDEKNKFICSCDAMIHAQSLGETFGISIGEFSINNKPIITYNGPVWNDNYKNILQNNAIYYCTEDECYIAMKNFNPLNYTNRDNNCYRDYTPEKVMKIFNEVFVKALGF